MGVVFEEERARGAQLACAVIGHERLEIGAGVQRVMFCEALLDPAGGGGDYGGIDVFVADIGDSLFQKGVEIRILWRHFDFSHV